MIHYKVKLKETGTCETLVYIDADGKRITKPKVKYKTQDDAIDACKIINAKVNQFHKVVPYKCKHCAYYHIGRNGKLLEK